MPNDTVYTNVDSIKVNTDLIPGIESETDKIDSAAVDGLSGVTDSLAYKVEEIENHIHTRERWGGLAAVPVGETHRTDFDSMTAFQLDAGNNDWGAWVQIMGSNDSPVITGMTMIDMHRIMITDVERKKAITRIQFAGGEDPDAAVASIDGNYTEILCTPDNDGKQDPYEIKMNRFPAGIKGWARCKVKGQDTGKIDLFIGIHEYIG